MPISDESSDSRSLPRFTDREIASPPESLPQFTAYTDRRMWIQGIRRYFALSFEAFAQRVGHSRASVVRYAQGERPITDHFLQDVARAFPILGLPEEISAHFRGAPPLLEDYAEVRKWFRAAREWLGLRHLDLARKFEKDKTTISMYELGKIKIPARLLAQFVEEFPTLRTSHHDAIERFREQILFRNRVVPYRESPPQLDEASRRGEWIRDTREFLGLTQEQFGRVIHRSGQVISEFEVGKAAVTDNTLLAVTRAFPHLANETALVSHFRGAPPELTTCRRRSTWMRAVRTYFGLNRAQFGREILVSGKMVRCYEQEIARVPDWVLTQTASSFPMLGVNSDSVLEHFHDKYLMWANRRSIGPLPLLHDFSDHGRWLHALRRFLGESPKQFGSRYRTTGGPIKRREAGKLSIDASFLRQAANDFHAGIVIKYVRSYLGLTQAQLGKTLYVPTQAINELERGRRRVRRSLLAAVSALVPELQLGYDPMDWKLLRDVRLQDFRTEGAWIHRLRVTAQLSQIQLGHLMKIRRSSSKTIWRIEKGESTPSIIFLRRLRDIFSLPPQTVREALQHFSQIAGGATHSSDPQADLFWELVATPVGSDEEKEKRNQIIINNLPQMKRSARAAYARLGGGSSSIAEFEELAYFVLHDATMNHNPLRGNFSNYLSKAIRLKLLSHVSEQKFPHLGGRDRITVIKVGNAIGRLQVALKRDPTDAEVAEASSVSISEVARATYLLSAPRTTGMDMAERELATSERRQSGFDESSNVDDVLMIEARLKDLPHGLALVRDHIINDQPLEKVAATLGIDPEEAANVLAHALNHLRAAMTSKGSIGGEEIDSDMDKIPVQASAELRPTSQSPHGQRREYGRNPSGPQQ